MYTLIETCILCGVDPQEYLRFTARATAVSSVIAGELKDAVDAVDAVDSAQGKKVILKP